jgi:hypothetical protein
MSGGKISEQMKRRVNHSDDKHYAKAQHSDLSGAAAQFRFQDRSSCGHLEGLLVSTIVSKLVLVVGRELVAECGETISKNCYISVNLGRGVGRAS